MSKPKIDSDGECRDGGYKVRGTIPCQDATISHATAQGTRTCGASRWLLTEFQRCRVSYADKVSEETNRKSNKDEEDTQQRRYDGSNNRSLHLKHYIYAPKS
jgi:hypothetical protein